LPLGAALLTRDVGLGRRVDGLWRVVLNGLLLLLALASQPIERFTGAVLEIASPCAAVVTGQGRDRER
jgi:hypothetical protein